MSASTKNQSGGIGFFGLLTILFIGLKLVSVISWSWWLVLLPLYGPISFALIILTVIGVIHLASRQPIWSDHYASLFVVQWFYCFTDGLSMLTSKEVAAIMKTQVPKLLHARIDELVNALHLSNHTLRLSQLNSCKNEFINEQVDYNLAIIKKGISV